jgi:hypothetical protein
MKATQHHTTDDEIIYILSIGKHAYNTRRLPRVSILRKYIDTAYSRLNWSGMNSEEIIRFAESELHNELNKVNA